MAKSTATKSAKSSTHFEIRVSNACMPNNCWGRYVHVAVLEVEDGFEAKQIRSTKHQRVVRVWRNCNVGTTARSASERAYYAAQDLIDELTAKRAA